MSPCAFWGCAGLGSQDGSERPGNAVVTPKCCWTRSPSCAARTVEVLPSRRERRSSGCTGSPCRTPPPRVLEGTLDGDEDVADERGSSRAPGERARGTLAFSGFWRRVCMGKNASPAGGMLHASPLSLGLSLMPKTLNAPS